jgi:serine O-acetyltransferase
MTLMQTGPMTSYAPVVPVVSMPLSSPGISATEPDWSREHKALFSWMPSRSLLASLRAYQYWRDSPLPWAPVFKKWAVLRHRFWSVVTGAEIPLNCRIGGGLLMPHPNGIVIHPDAEIGPNCLILQQVTVGATSRGVPRLGGHVDVGAGAKILGPIQVGNEARIGANTLVIRDVPARATMVTAPAEVLLL